MTGANHPWCKNIKYWEENSIVHSFVDSQFYSLSFHYEIYECLLGLNSYILDPNLGMASWTFRAFMHYRLHGGGISFPSLIFWTFINVFQTTFQNKKFFSKSRWIAKGVHGFQLLAWKVEDQKHLALGLQLLAWKVDDQKHLALGLQLLAPKVEVQEHLSSDLQLLALKVED